MLKSPIVRTPIKIARNVTKSKYLSPTRSPIWLRLVLIALLAGLFTFTQYGTEDPFDTFICVAVYSGWLFFCLPGLYRKLNMQLLISLTTVVFRLYAADFVYRLYRTGRRFAYGTAPAFDPFGDVLNQHWFINGMGIVRIFVIIYCLGYSVYKILEKKYPKHLRKSARKAL